MGKKNLFRSFKLFFSVTAMLGLGTLHAEEITTVSVQRLIDIAQTKIKTNAIEVDGKIRGVFASGLKLSEVKRLDPLEMLMVSTLAMEELNRKILAKRQPGESLEDLRERVELVFKNPRDIEKIQVSFGSPKKLNQLRDVQTIHYSSFESMWKIELAQAEPGILPKAGWLEGVYEGMVHRITTDLQSQGLNEYIVRSMKEVLVGVAIGFTGIATIPGVNWALMGLGMWSMRHDVFGLVTNLFDGDQAGYHLGGIFKSLFTMLLGYGAGRKLNQLLLLLKKFPKLSVIAQMVEKMNKAVDSLSKTKKRGPYFEPPTIKKVDGKAPVTPKQPGVKLKPQEVTNLKSGGKPTRSYSDDGSTDVLTMTTTRVATKVQVQPKVQTAVAPEALSIETNPTLLLLPIEQERRPTNYVHTLDAYHAFRAWRKDFTSANQEVENKLTSIEALLKKAPYYVTASDVDDVQYLSRLPILNPQIKAAIPSYITAAKNIPPTNHVSPLPHPNTKSDLELIQEALSGVILLTSDHISALARAERRCSAANSYNRPSNELCRKIRERLAHLGVSLKKQLGIRNPVRFNPANLLEDMIQGLMDYLRRNDTDELSSGLASQMADRELGRKVRNAFVDYVYSPTPQTAHPHLKRIIPADLLTKIDAEVMTDLQTVRLSPKGGRYFDDAQAKLVLFHGLGFYPSKNSVFTGMLTTLGLQADGKPIGKSDTRKTLVSEFDENYPKLSMEALDFIGHGNGPNLLDYLTLDQIMGWMKRYFDSIRSENQQPIPIIVLARSGSPIFVLEFNRRYPGYIDGLVLMSPTYPGFPNELFEKISDTTISYMQSGSHNVPSYNWVDYYLLNLFWEKEHFETIPTLFLTGDDDKDISPEEKAIYESMASTFKNTDYLNIPGVGHDVFRPTDPKDKEAKMTAYRRLIQFINRVIQKP